MSFNVYLQRTAHQPSFFSLPTLPNSGYVRLMRSKPVAGLARAALGGMLACALLLCSFASFSPVLHKALHPDAQSADHICQLGLWGKNQFLATTSVSPQPLVVEAFSLPPLPTQILSCLFDSLASPTRGPPRLS
jgi:hypothetical protein